MGRHLTWRQRRLLGYLVRKARKSKNVSAKELAKWLNTPLKHFKDFERGYAPLSEQQLAALPALLGLKATSLFFAPTVIDACRRFDEDIYFQRACLLDYGTYFRVEFNIGFESMDETDRICKQIETSYSRRTPQKDLPCPHDMSINGLTLKLAGLSLFLFRLRYDIPIKKFCKALAIPPKEYGAIEFGWPGITDDMLILLSNAWNCTIKELICFGNLSDLQQFVGENYLEAMEEYLNKRHLMDHCVT